MLSVLMDFTRLVMNGQPSQTMLQKSSLHMQLFFLSQHIFVGLFDRFVVFSIAYHKQLLFTLHLRLLRQLMLDVGQSCLDETHLHIARVVFVLVHDTDMGRFVSKGTSPTYISLNRVTMICLPEISKTRSVN